MIGELEYDYTIHSTPKAGDDKLAIRFFVKPMQDIEKSQEAKRPIFNDVEYIQIMVPGDRSNINQRPVSKGDKARFAAQYEHWKKTQAGELIIGTPLEAWGVLSLSQVEEYRYFGIRSVEQMADLNDGIAGKIMGATSLKQRAQNFVAIKKDEAPMARIQTELDKRDNEIATLTAALEAQGKELAQLRAQRE